MAGALSNTQVILIDKYSKGYSRIEYLGRGGGGIAKIYFVNGCIFFNTGGGVYHSFSFFIDGWWG